MAKTNYQDGDVLNAEDVNALSREINELGAELWPLDLTVTISPNELKEKGSGATVVTLNWTGKIKGEEVAIEESTVNDGEPLAVTTYTESVTDSKTFNVRAKAQGRTAEKSAKVTYVYPTYLFFATEAEVAQLTLTGKQPLATSLNYSKKSMTNDKGADAYLWIVSGYTPATVQSEDGLVIAIGGSVRTTANGLKYWRSNDKLSAGNWVLTIKS